MRELLSDAIDNYERFRRSQSYSKNTLKVDAQVMNRFLTVNGNIWCHNVTPRHVERHFEEASRTRGPSSLSNDYATLRGFFRWARHTKRMPTDSDPMYGRRKPRPAQRERNRVPVSRFPDLLDAAGAKDPRNRAFIALLLYTLGRESEVANIKMRDLDLQGGQVKVWVQKSRVEDVLPICSELDHELRTWLTAYTVACGPLEPHFYLIPSRRTHPIRDEETGRILRHVPTYRPEKRLVAANRVVNPILSDIGFPVQDADGRPAQEGAHTIRRSGARALFDRLVADGYDHGLRIVQSLLHHKNMSQTETYIGVTADRRSRDDYLRGKEMFPFDTDNVVRLAK